jgi:hypothetical protein
MRYMVLISLIDGGVSRDTLTQKLIRDEVQTIKELLASGKCIDAWRRFDKIGIVLFLEVENETECRALIETLPFRRAGVLDVELVMAVERYTEIY